MRRRLGMAAVSAALVLLGAAAGAAHADGSYTTTSETGHLSGSSPDGTANASADMDSSGSFSLAASASDSGLNPDGQAALGGGHATASKTFAIDTGAYDIRVVFSHLNGHADATGLGNAEATVATSVSCPSCNQAPSNDTVVGTTPPASADSGDRTVTHTIYFVATGPDTITVTAIVDASAASGRFEAFGGNDLHWVGVHGGSASVTLSGVVESITVTPVPPPV